MQEQHSWVACRFRPHNRVAVTAVLILAVFIFAVVVLLLVPEAERRDNDQVWEEMRRLQRIGDEATTGGDSDAARASRLNPFEGLPIKVRFLDARGIRSVELSCRARERWGSNEG